MKKLLLSIIVITLIMTICPVFAANVTTITTADSTGDIEVIYTVEDSYVISIPETLTLAKGATVKSTISARDVCIEYGTELNVKINGANCDNQKRWYIEDEEHAQNRFEYMISTKYANPSGDVLNGDAVLTVPAGNTEGGTADLYFELKDDVNKSGTYSDVLTFSASIDKATEIVVF